VINLYSILLSWSDQWSSQNNCNKQWDLNYQQISVTNRWLRKRFSPNTTRKYNNARSVILQLNKKLKQEKGRVKVEWPTTGTVKSHSIGEIRADFLQKRSGEEEEKGAKWLREWRSRKHEEKRKQIEKQKTHRLENSLDSFQNCSGAA